MDLLKKIIWHFGLMFLTFFGFSVQAQNYTHHNQDPEARINITGKYTAKIKSCGDVPCDADIEIKQKSGDRYRFSIGSGHPGPMPSICNVDGEFTATNDQAEWKSKTSKCHLTFSFKISAEDDYACQRECGAGAGFLGTYKKVR
jgi:hypothetical protein